MAIKPGAKPEKELKLGEWGVIVRWARLKSWHAQIRLLLRGNVENDVAHGCKQKANRVGNQQQLLREMKRMRRGALRCSQSSPQSSARPTTARSD